MIPATNNELLPDVHHKIDEVNIACGAHPGEEPFSSTKDHTAAVVIVTLLAVLVLGLLFL